MLRFDMTGLGGSEGDFSRSSFTTNLADLRSAIRFASSELGPVTALVGHSFGGAASLAIAGNLDGANEDDAGPLAIVALAAPSDTQHLSLLLAAMNREIESTGIGTVSIGGRQWSIRREMLEDFQRHDLPAAISKIQVPTLLFHSPDDGTVSFDHAIRIMGLIQSSPSGGGPVSLVTLDGADHLLSEQDDIELVGADDGGVLETLRAPLGVTLVTGSQAAFVGQSVGSRLRRSCSGHDKRGEPSLYTCRLPSTR